MATSTFTRKLFIAYENPKKAQKCSKIVKPICTCSITQCCKVVQDKFGKKTWLSMSLLAVLHERSQEIFNISKIYSCHLFPYDGLGIEHASGLKVSDQLVAYATRFFILRLKNFYVIALTRLKTLKLSAPKSGPLCFLK